MRRAFWLLLAAGLAAACGGGDLALGPGDGGVGSGGTGVVAVVASGPVSGFGSIIVNGTRYETDTARFELRDATALRLGMTVQVTGTVSADFSTGTATRVVSAAQLRGSVAGLDVAGRTLQVTGVRVSVDDATVIAQPGGLSALAQASQLVVWGLPHGGGLLATRIEALSAAAGETIVTDTVRELDPTSGRFRLGDLEVAYGPDDLHGSWSGGAVVAGQAARVSGRIGNSGVLEASRVEPVDPAPAPPATVVSLSGKVAQWDGRRFRLDGYTIDSAGAEVTGGGVLAQGVRVDVVGSVRDGVLAASRIRIRQESPGGAAAAVYSAAGPIAGQVDAGQFLVQGQAIDASGAAVQFVNGTRADLRPGRKVLVSGSRVQADVLVAERVEFAD